MRIKEIAKREWAWRKAQREYAKVLETPCARRREGELGEATAKLHQTYAEYQKALNAGDS